MKSIKSLFLNKWLHKCLLFITAALFGLISSLSLPALSIHIAQGLSPQTVLIDADRALKLAQKGQEYYYAGNLIQAVSMWQQATEVYQKIGDRRGELKSAIALAQAFYDLGRYARARDTLFQAFATEEHPRADEKLLPSNEDERRQELDTSLSVSEEKIEQLLANLSRRKDNLSIDESIGLRSMGNILRREGLLEQSQQFLQLSLAVNKNSSEESATLLSLGNTERTKGNRLNRSWNYGKITEIVERESIAAAIKPYQAAFAAYQQAAKIASSPLTRVQAHINQLSLWLEIEKWWAEQVQQRLIAVPGLEGVRSQLTAGNILVNSQADRAFIPNQETRFFSRLEAQIDRDIQALNNQIKSELASLPPGRGTVYTLINFAKSLMELPSEERTESVLNLALQQSQTLGDRVGESYALGYLGQWYFQQNQLEKASKFTQQALLIAQQESINSDVREITYLWQAQLGKLWQEQGQPTKAIAAYTAAFNSLQSLRADLNGNIQEVQFDFRQEVKPVYLALADLLLQEKLSPSELNSLVVVNPSPNQSYSSEKIQGDRLELTRRVIESLQLAELDNFFQDPCAREAQVAIEIDNLDRQAAVIYPIILPDRLEIILSLPQQSLRQITVPVTEKEINQLIQAIHNNLDNVDVDNSASNILATSNPTPVELQENIETLLPLLSSLYSWLIQPIEPELKSQEIDNLVFVINGSLQTVPLTALYDGQQYLIEKYGVALAPSLQLINPQSLNRDNLKVVAAGVSQSVEARGKIFPSLPNVSRELAQIQQIFPQSKILLDREFTSTAIQEQLQDNFSIIHLATHGLFSSEPNNSFIITGNGKTLDFQQLSQILNARENIAPELLVLSACQTATGDEQAVLGLAGIVIRSGAKSTLATLWSVEDASTAKLISNFYQELKKSEETKLAALRNAQLSLIESLRENPPFAELKHLPPHPYYWAPYVLVGNWL